VTVIGALITLPRFSPAGGPDSSWSESQGDISPQNGGDAGRAACAGRLAMLVRRVESTPATGDACRSSRLSPHDDCRACPGSLQGNRPEVHQAGQEGALPLVRHLGMVRPQHGSTYRRSETTAMSDAVDRLAQALRDLISEAVQAAVERERATPPAARVVERPQIADEEFDPCPWCNK
jgi:hypothetical protein